MLERLCLAAIISGAAIHAERSSPDLSRLDPQVAEQIRSAQERFDAAPPDNAEAHGELARYYHVYDLFDRAAELYLKAGTLSPRDYRWQYYLAHVYQKQDQLHIAARLYTSALELNPEYRPALLRLAESNLQLDRLDQASSLYRRALAIDSSNAAALAGLGKIDLKRGAHASAIKNLEAALSLQPQATALHYSLAMAYRATGDTEKAKQLLAKRGSGLITFTDPLIDGLQELKTGKHTFWTRGWKAMMDGRYSEAVGQFRKMAEADPKEPVAWLELGSALLRIGEPAKSLDAYNTALQLAPNNPILHQNLGVCLTQLGFRDRAIEHYRRAVQLNPALADSYFHLANELMRLQRFEEAAEYYHKGVELKPDNQFGLYMEAMVLVRLRRYDDARAKLEAAAQAFPEDLDIRHVLARLLAAAPDDKVRDGHRALELMLHLFREHPAPEFDHGQTIAMAFAETGQLQQAALLQKKLLDQVQQAGRPDLVPLVTSNLSHYERGEPCREPWRDDDPVFAPVPRSLVPTVANINASAMSK